MMCYCDPARFLDGTTAVTLPPWPSDICRSAPGGRIFLGAERESMVTRPSAFASLDQRPMKWLPGSPMAQLSVEPSVALSASG
jgi:hypothetical protein